MGEYRALVVLAVERIGEGVTKVVTGTIQGMELPELERAILVNTLIDRLDRDDLQVLVVGYTTALENIEMTQARHQRHRLQLEKIGMALSAAIGRFRERMRPTIMGGLQEGDTLSIRWQARGPNKLDELISAWMEVSRRGSRLVMDRAGSEECTLRLSRAPDRQTLVMMVSAMALTHGLKIQGDPIRSGQDVTPIWSFRLESLTQ